MSGDHPFCSQSNPPAPKCHGAMLLCAVIFLSGCVNPQILLPISHDNARVTTVRSQDSTLGDQFAPTSDPAATSRFASQFASQSGSTTDTINPNRVRPVSGHSFAQPRARLGRPTPLSAQQPATNSLPVVGHSEILENRNAGAGMSRGAASQNSPWGNGGSAWQTGATSHGNFSGPTNSVGASSAALGSASTVSAQPAAATSPEQQGSNSGAQSRDAAEDNAAMEETPAEVTTEPTMLDRLRGLYNPRIDENTDKLRKQIRRWPDPFGLLKDREESTEAGTDTHSPEANNNSSPQSAELTQTQPPVVAATALENSHIQSAIQELEAELAAWPKSISGDNDRTAEWRQKQTDLRLLYMIAGKSAESVRIIESLPEEEQEFWQSLMMSMNSYRDASEEVDRREQLTESLRHLRTASKELQPLARLTIQRAMLCDRIDGFGNVVAYPTSNFEPGQRVLVYTELQNFQSELTEDGKYRSEFAARIEFMREGDDEVLEKIQVLQIEDLCDVERTDYFQSFELTLPALEGKYRMRILLRDYLSQQVAESSLEFSVRSQSGSPVGAAN